MASQYRYKFVDKVLKIRVFGKQEKKFLLLERHGKTLPVLSYRSFTKLTELKLPHNHILPNTTILDFEVSNSQELICAMNSDRKFFFWSFGHFTQPITVGEIDILMNNIWRIEPLDYWVTSSANPPVVKFWKFNNYSLSEVNIQIDHNKVITSLFYVKICLLRSLV